MSVLCEGRIPPKTECPFKGQCAMPRIGSCTHAGANEEGKFSCSTARAFDFIIMRKSEKYGVSIMKSIQE